MLFFSKHNQLRVKADKTIEASSVEVTNMQTEIKQSAVKTKRDIDRLNRLLKANGITLKIHIASGGHGG